MRWMCGVTAQDEIPANNLSSIFGGRVSRVKQDEMDMRSGRRIIGKRNVPSLKESLHGALIIMCNV